MASGSVAAVAAGACLALAAAAHLRDQRLGTWLNIMGGVMLLGALSARGLRTARWPLASRYEFTLAFALGTLLAVLALPHQREDRISPVRAASVAIAAALVLWARLGMPSSERAIVLLPPALDSAWLPLHVGTAALAYGALTVAGVASILWLTRKGERAEAAMFLDQAVTAGYLLLTLSMLLGMIWAHVAWGRYWDWDLKEVWTMVTWLTYTLYWHVRRRPNWQGRRLAWVTLAGGGAVWFTFMGAGWLARTVALQSLHLF